MQREKTKKAAYDIKMAVTIENHPGEVFSMQDPNIDIDSLISKLSQALSKALPEKQYKIYDMLYVQHMDEEDVANVMGYKTTEKGRKAGYKQLKNLKKLFKEKAINILKKGEIMAYETAANSVNRTKGKS